MVIHKYLYKKLCLTENRVNPPAAMSHAKILLITSFLF